MNYRYFLNQFETIDELIYWLFKFKISQIWWDKFDPYIILEERQYNQIKSRTENDVSEVVNE